MLPVDFLAPRLHCNLHQLLMNEICDEQCCYRCKQTHSLIEIHRKIDEAENTCIGSIEMSTRTHVTVDKLMCECTFG